MPFFLLFSLLAVQAYAVLSPNAEDRLSGISPRIISRVFDKILAEDLETPMQFRAIMYLDISVWGAWSSYHPTAVDIFGRSRFRRPVSERTTENRNTAVLFSMFRLYQASPQSFGGPSRIQEFRNIIAEMGHDPDNNTTDLSTSIGIGNRQGRDTARLMKIDGWNSQGDLTATAANYRIPFADYTSYTPKNTPWAIKYPFKWQPLLENNGLGFFFRQESVAPFAGSSIAFSQTKQQIRRRKVRLPYRRSHASVRNALNSDVRRLKELARNVLQTSAQLTEKQRVLAELFDNKIKGFSQVNTTVSSIGIALRFRILGPSLDWDMEKDMMYALSSGIATFDSMVVAWKEKRRLDAVRPTGQTMKFLFGNRKFKVWGGPGKKAVMIKAGEWQPYIRTMPHAEFPSGSSCTCSVLVEHALANTNKKDDFRYQFTVPKGSSRFYPGQVPENDMVITINRLSDWNKLCGQSRLWAGVHFEPSVKAGEKLCRGIGEASQDFVRKLVAGKLDAKWLTWLPRNVERFWEEK